MVSNAQVDAMVSLFKQFAISGSTYGVNVRYINPVTGVSVYVMQKDNSGNDTATSATFDSNAVSTWVALYGFDWIRLHDPAEYAILTSPATTNTSITSTVASTVSTMNEYTWLLVIAIIAVVLFYLYRRY